MNEWTGIVFSPVTPSYFRTLGIPIKWGGKFTEHDTAASQPVVIINEAAAQRYFGTSNPVGQQIEPRMWDGSGSNSLMRTIVGVVGNIKFYNPAQPANPTIYWPIAQIPSNSSLYVVIRTAGNPLNIVNAVRRQLQSMDKTCCCITYRLLISTLVNPWFSPYRTLSYSDHLLLSL